jgi:hypothetical protein
MKRSIFSLVSLICLSLAIIGMVSVPQKVVSKEQAISIADKFITTAALPSPKRPAQVRDLPAYTGLGNRWEVIYPGDYRLTIHKIEGIVRGFTNDRRLEEQFKRRQNRSNKRFETAAEAISMLNNMANRLGLCSQAHRSKLEYIPDNDTSRSDSNKAGRIHVQYRTKPFGYEFIGPEIGNGMGLTIDPVDGALVSFAQSWDIKIESHVVVVNKSEAVKNAEIAFRAYRRVRRSPHSTADQAVSRIEVGYVIPNGGYGSHFPSRERVRLARLAYVVFFGTESVWIDAATGKLLGGQSFA